MSSDLPVGTYKRYKAGTHKLITWLQSAAEQDKALPGPSSKSPSKKKQKTSQAESKKVAVDQLVTFAQTIVQATDPTIEIPIDILDVAKDAINGRQWACEWYAAFAESRENDLPENFAVSNNQHRHFLTVLKQVFEILRVEFRKRQPKRKKKIELAADKDDLNNLFLHLELEEPSEADQKPTPQLAKKVAPDQHVSDKQSKSSLEDNLALDNHGEKLFAFWCLLQDLWELRFQTRKVWQQYVDGHLSFTTACQTFDKAVHIAHDLSTEFLGEHGVGSYQELMTMLGDTLYMATARAHQAELNGFSVKRGENTSRSSLEAGNHYEFMLMPAWCTLIDLRQITAFMHLPTLSDGLKLEPTMIYPPHPFAAALLQVAGDLEPYMYDQLGKKEPKYGFPPDYLFRHYGDLYSNSIIDWMEMGVLEPGLLAATMMYFDLHDILGGDLERGIRECEPILERMRKAFDEFESFCERISEDLRKTIMTPYMFDCLRRAHSLIVPERSDAVAEGWRIFMDHHAELRLDAAHDQTQYSTLVPMNVLATLPVWAGHAVAFAQQGMQMIDMMTCNINKTVLSAAHLYRAAQLQGSLTVDWRAMTYIIMRENEIARFVQAGDGTVRGVAVSYCMALGLSLSEVAGTHRPTLPSIKAASRDAIEMMNLSHFTLSPDNGSKASRSWTGFTKRDLRSRRKLALRDLYSAVNQYSKSAGIKDETLAEQWRSTKRVSGSQLLQLVQEIFSADEIYANFDFLQVYAQCVEIIGRTLNAYVGYGSARPVSRKGKDMNRPKEMYEEVYGVLWDAVNAEQRGRNQDRTVLFHAGRIMEAIIIGERDAAFQQARDLSSGHIPDTLVPTALYGPAAVAVLPRQYPRRLHIHNAFDAGFQAQLEAEDRGEVPKALPRIASKNAEERVRRIQEMAQELYGIGERLVVGIVLHHTPQLLASVHSGVTLSFGEETG